MLLGAAAALALSAGPAAAETWTAQTAPNLGAPSALALTGDGAGELFAVQLAQPGDSSTSGAYLSTRAPGGAFSTPARTPDGGLPEIRGDDAGTALAVETPPGGAAAVRTRPFGGAFGAPVQTIAIAAPTFSGVGFTLRPDGAALAAWADGTALKLADRPAGLSTTFGTPASPPSTTISGPGFGSTASSVPLAFPILDADGGADVLFSHTGSMNAGYSLLQTRRPAGGAFAAGTALVSDITSPAFAFDAAGDAIAVWRAGNTLAGSFRPHGGSFGAPVQIATAPDSGSAQNVSLTEISVALTPGGVAQVAWERYVPGASCSAAGGVHSVGSATRSAAGTWSTPAYALGTTPIVTASLTDERTALLWDGSDCAVSGSTVFPLMASVGAPASYATATGVAGGDQSDTDFAKTAAFDGTGAATALWVGSDTALHAASTPATGTPSTPVGGGDGGGGGGSGDTGTTPPATTPPAATPPATASPVIPPAAPPTKPKTDVLTIGLVSLTPGGLTLSSTQRPTVTAACDTACQITIGAVTHVGEKGVPTDPTAVVAAAKPRSASFTSKAITKKLKAHKKLKLTIALSAKARRAVKAALKAHQHAAVTVTIRVKGTRKVGRLIFLFKP